MIKSGTYGDAAELFAAASSLYTNIHVLQLRGAEAFLYADVTVPGTRSEIFLAFNVALKHYSALVPFHVSDDRPISDDNTVLPEDGSSGDLSSASVDPGGNISPLSPDHSDVDISGLSCDDPDDDVLPRHMPYGSSKPRHVSAEPPPGK